MSDIGDTFDVLKKMGQEKRAKNRESSAKYLDKECIPYESKNNGAHLIVEGSQCFIDYWPGTGRWYARNGVRGFGVRSLITAIKIKGEA